MDQEPTEAQASNGVQLPTWIHEPTPPLFDLLGPSESRTPLGGLMNHISEWVRAEDPLGWHLHFWLNIGVVGILCGNNSTLMSLRIDIEILNIPDRELKFAIHDAWSQYRRVNREVCERHWARMTLESEEAQPYIRDIHKMLEGKAWKTKRYLRGMEETMTTMVRDRKFDVARLLFDKLCLAYKKLQEEEEADAETSRSILGILNGNHEGQVLEA